MTPPKIPKIDFLPQLAHAKGSDRQKLRGQVPSRDLVVGNFFEEIREGAECRPLRGNLVKGSLRR